MISRVLSPGKAVKKQQSREMNYNITFKEIRDKGLFVINKSVQRTGEFSHEMMIVGIEHRIPQNAIIAMQYVGKSQGNPHSMIWDSGQGT